MTSKELQQQLKIQISSSNETKSVFDRKASFEKSTPYLPDLVNTDLRSHLDYFNPMQSTSVINILESLQSKLKQKDGEIVQLQVEIIEIIA